MWTVYTKQFEAGVWLMVIVVIVALSVVLYLVLRYSRQDDDVSVSESFFVIVVYIFGQSKKRRDLFVLCRERAKRTSSLPSTYLEGVRLDENDQHHSQARVSLPKSNKFCNVLSPNTGVPESHKIIIHFIIKESFG